MAALPPREQALALLAAANNHGDLAVKLSSLKQAKDILLSAEPSQAAELFPFLVELQFSPEILVRKTLIDVIQEIGLNALEHSCILMPGLLTLLKDENPLVAKQSIIAVTSFFCSVLEELALQRGIVETWHGELWSWMIKFKDAIIGILFEAASLGIKLMAIKFLEIQVLLLTSDRNDSERFPAEAISREGRRFNISWLGSHHPVLDPATLALDANRSLGILLELLRSAKNLPAFLTISVVNSLAAIARRRPIHYNTIFSALLEFDPHFEMAKGGHSASIQYSIRTAFLGFLRCTHPLIMESREKLLKTLRAMNAGDAADQAIRQVEKMMRSNERASREARLSKDEQQPSSHFLSSGDQGRKRSLPSDNEAPCNDNDIIQKKVRYGTHNVAAHTAEKSDLGLEYMNGMSPKGPLLDSNLTPVEQMIAMIGALIAEGERGVESLELLVSNMHPDLLADIVITNMRHLPKNPPPLTRVSTTQQGDSLGSQGVIPSLTNSMAAQDIVVQVPVSSSNVTSTPLPDMSASSNLPSDSKRDPRRDPRRLDPRRMAVSVSLPVTPTAEDNAVAAPSGSVQISIDAPSSFNAPFSSPIVSSSEDIAIPVMPKPEAGLTASDSSLIYVADAKVVKEDVEKQESKETVPGVEEKAASDVPHLSVAEVEQDSIDHRSSGVTLIDEPYSPPSEEMDELSPAISNPEAPEDSCVELPMLPSFVDLSEEQKRNLKTLAIRRVFDSYKILQGSDSNEMRLQLLARLVAQIDAEDDAVLTMQKHLALDYHHQKGHELVMHVLYHLHSLIVSESEQTSSSAAAIYDKFLMGVAKSLLDTLPATDKSFGRLLSEVPLLSDSVMSLLGDLCGERYSGKDDGDRVTQGLGAVWTLILVRPVNRQACLDLALKCAVHPQDDIRVKAIRLVANKLYVLDYISETIEQHATRMFLSALDHRGSDMELSESGATEKRTERELGSQETSISGSQVSEPGLSESDSAKCGQIDNQGESMVTVASAQRHISLFFALCPKNPRLLQLVFDNYARAPKGVKQAVHRQIPVLIRALGSSYSQLLQIISDPPQGSENLLTQVLHILSEGTTPPPDLIATVKQLYENKLKDATILIPILSSFSKNEVLPIFPRLVDLPLDKFQTALAHILQGSAHTGPALTPAEVMVAIHNINPERDHIPLKKIMDACSVCFEQRTVFTQQVMAKALSQMVDQTPLPLLFMRTVIQTTDAFPSLVDFVMEILSKLVNRQVWRMPKLWVGFLKCMSQTQPHSYRVLLQLPSPQLESALNKYAYLRGPLAVYANQPSIKSSLPRSTLVLLGLGNEPDMQQSQPPSSLHSSDTSSTVHGTMPT